MNYEEEFFKQMVVKGNKGYGGFAIITSVLGIGIFATYLLIKWIFKGIINMLQTNQENNMERDVQRKATITLLKLLQATNNDIQFNIVKSHTNRSTGELTQWINFIAFNEEKRTVEVINTLVNTVLNNTLNICNSKDLDLKGTVITKNYEIETIKDNLKIVTGQDIYFKNF